MTAYGFAVALAVHGSGCAPLLDSRRQALENDSTVTVDRPGKTSLVVRCVPERGDFVSSTMVGSWFVISIGSAGLDRSPAALVGSALACEPAPDSDDIRSAFQRIFGQYAAVAFDTSGDGYLAVSDPSGVRSLFSCRLSDSLLVASSIPMLNRLATRNAWEPDTDNQPFLLRYGHMLPGRSIYRHVREIPPARLFESDRRRSRSTRSHEPASAAPTAVDDREIESQADCRSLMGKYEARLLGQLTRACKEQLGGATKVGVLLGGFDSALVASLLIRLGVDVETYSFRYESSSYNQPLVDELARDLGIRHHWIDITPEVIRRGIDEYGTSCNWPTLWLNYVVQTQHLCRRMSADGMQSCFSGDGCDAIFLGYPSTHRRGRMYQRMPMLGHTASQLFVSAFHALRLESVLGHVGRVSLSLLSAAAHPADDRAIHSFQLFDSRLQTRLTGSNTTVGPHTERYLADLLERSAGLSYERKVYMAKSLISPNRCKLVGSSDVSGLTIQSPYLHPGVARFARELPVQALRPQGGAAEGKDLLMKMAENSGLLPREVIHQPKIAAIKSPIDDWLSQELSDFVSRKLESLPFAANSAYLNRLQKGQWAEQVYKRRFANDGVVGLALSLLITYASFFGESDA